MRNVRPIVISSISIFLIALILIVLILGYPMNLIVDSILLSIVGISSLAYVLIWAFQKDKAVISDGYITIFWKVFPILVQKQRTLYPKFIMYFYLNDNGAALVMKDGEVINIEDAVDEKNNRIGDLASALKKMKIKQVTMDEHLRHRPDRDKSYLYRI